MRNATDVIATGIPIVPKYETPAPTRNVMPAPANRPTDVANANALARHSVEYCSGSHSETWRSWRPPRSEEEQADRNHGSAFLAR